MRREAQRDRRLQRLVSGSGVRSNARCSVTAQRPGRLRRRRASAVGVEPAVGPRRADDQPGEPRRLQCRDIGQHRLQVARRQDEIRRRAAAPSRGTGTPQRHGRGHQPRPRRQPAEAERGCTVRSGRPPAAAAAATPAGRLDADLQCGRCSPASFGPAQFSDSMRHDLTRSEVKHNFCSAKISGLPDFCLTKVRAPHSLGRDPVERAWPSIDTRDRPADAALGRARPGLSPKLRAIAGFALEEPERFIRNTSREICAALGTSEPTLIRFCQLFGYSGLSDFRIDLALALAKHARGAGFVEPLAHDRRQVNTAAKSRHRRGRGALVAERPQPADRQRLDGRALRAAPRRRRRRRRS